MRKKFNNNGGGQRRQGGGGQRRYGNNNNRQGGGGNNDGQNLSRQKHHATQMREKFSNMARDAQNNGDRVDVEYYLQHVDHYTRVLTDIAAIEAERFAHQREQQQAANPQGAEGGEGQADAAPAEGGDNGGEVQNFNNNQPRMTRQPRYNRPENAAPAAAPAEANTNDEGGDIPLPGLPTV